LPRPNVEIIRIFHYYVVVYAEMNVYWILFIYLLKGRKFLSGLRCINSRPYGKT